MAEGVNTARSIQRLSEREGVDMPLSQGVAMLLFEDVDPRDAVGYLMQRPLKQEAG